LRKKNVVSFFYFLFLVYRTFSLFYSFLMFLFCGHRRFFLSAVVFFGVAEVV